MTRAIKKGSTDISVVIRIVDSGDGTPETGVVYNSSGIDLWYRRQGATKTSITEATLSALSDAHSDGGVLHIGDGYYRLDLPDAAVASGADSVAIGGTVSGMVVIGTELQLVDNITSDVISELAKVPKSDGTTTWNATALASINSECDTALADYDGPTNAEMEARTLTSASYATAAAVATVDGKADQILEDTGTTLPSTLATIASYIDTEVGAIQSSIDGLNDLDATAVQAAAAAALTAYDPPTNAEMEARTVVAASYATATELAKVPKSDSNVTWNATALASINAEVLDVLNTDTLIDGKTFVESQKINSSILAGQISGAGTGTEVFLGLDGATTRVTVTVDSSGNRTSVVYA